MYYSSGMPLARKAGGFNIKINSNGGFRKKYSEDPISKGCLALDPEVGYKPKGCVVISKGGSIILFGQNKKWDLNPVEKRQLEKRLSKNLSCEIITSMGQDFIQVKNRPDTRIDLDDIGLISALEILISRL